MQLFSQCIGRSNRRVTPPILVVTERFPNDNFIQTPHQPVQPVPVQPVQFENINALMPNISSNQVSNYSPSICTSTAPQPINENRLPIVSEQLSSSQLSNPVRTNQPVPLRETNDSSMTSIYSYTSVLGKNINRIKYNKGDNSLLYSTNNLKENISINLSRDGATFEGPKVNSSRLYSGSIDITIEGPEDENGNRAQVGQGHINRNGDINGSIYS